MPTLHSDFIQPLYSPTVERTDSGGVSITGFLARSGVLLYKTGNEYRPPAENQALVEGGRFDGLPVVDSHPSKGLINPRIDGDLIKGRVATGAIHIYSPKYDDGVVKGTLVIEDDDLVRKIFSRGTMPKVGLSLGYQCQSLPGAGIWTDCFTGRDYRFDSTQMNIIPNHAAVVYNPRGGDSLSLDLEKADEGDDPVIVYYQLNKDLYLPYVQKGDSNMPITQAPEGVAQTPDITGQLKQAVNDAVTEIHEENDQVQQLEGVRGQIIEQGEDLLDAGEYNDELEVALDAAEEDISMLSDHLAQQNAAMAANGIYYDEESGAYTGSHKDQIASQILEASGYEYDEELGDFVDPAEDYDDEDEDGYYDEYGNYVDEYDEEDPEEEMGIGDQTLLVQEIQRMDSEYDISQLKSPLDAQKVLLALRCDAIEQHTGPEALENALDQGTEYFLGWADSQWQSLNPDQGVRTDAGDYGRAINGPLSMAAKDYKAKVANVDPFDQTRSANWNKPLPIKKAMK